MTTRSAERSWQRLCPLPFRSGCKPPAMIVCSAQVADAASQLAVHRARKTTISLMLLATHHFGAASRDCSIAQQCTAQRTLARLCLGLATVRVRMHRHGPRRTLFRIHCLSKKPGCFRCDERRLRRLRRKRATLAAAHRTLHDGASIALTEMAVKTRRNVARRHHAPLSSHATSAGVSATSKAAALAAYSAPLAHPTSGKTANGCAST